MIKRGEAIRPIMGIWCDIIGDMWMNSNDMATSLDTMSTGSKAKSLEISCFLFFEFSSFCIFELLWKSIYTVSMNYFGYL